MGKAVYSKRLGERADMCTECYREGHFRRECPGSRNWSEYCVEFKEIWEKQMNYICESDEMEEPVGEDSSLLTRLARSEREKKEQKRISEKEQQELNDQVRKQKETVEEMKRMNEFSERKVEVLNKKLEEAERQVERVKAELFKKMDLGRSGTDLIDEVNKRDSRIIE